MDGDGRNGSSDFATLLRRHRLAAGLSQLALAERARVSPRGISALESGYRRSPQRQTLNRLSGALALNADDQRAFNAAAAKPAMPRRRRSAAATAPWSTAPPGLPVALTSFVGRDSELDEIAALLAEHRLVTITGAGGVGKTQTALRAAQVAAGRLPGAVYLIALATIGDSSSIPVAIASALGVQAMPNHPLLQTLVAFLRDKPVLLLLDNCEHVVLQAAVVAETLLTGCPQLAILATSREPLAAAGERAYRLPSLEAEDAIRLFVDRARAADHRFSLDGESLTAVAEICRRLDGIPLAIELAASRVCTLSVDALVARLDDRFRILTGGHRTALPRHQTMRAAIDWSYAILAEPEQRLLERLSVFRGAFTLAAASAICVADAVAEVDMLAIVTSLVQKSLLSANVDGSEARYRLLESFREYARELLARRDEERTFTHRHAHACFEFAKRSNRRDFAKTAASERRAIFEVSDLRAALERMLSGRGDVLLGQRLAAEVGTWNSFGLADGRRWIGEALDLVDARTPQEVRAALNFANAYTGNNFRLHRATLAACENALPYYRAAGEGYRTAWMLGLAAEALYCLGERTRATALLQEALPIARTLEGHDRLALAHILRTIPRVCEIEMSEARRLMAEAMQIYAELGDETNVAHALNDLSVCEFRGGNVDLAIAHAADAVASANPFGLDDAAARAWAFNYMSLYLSTLERYAEASTRSREALCLARERHWDLQAAWSIEQLAAIALLRATACTIAPPDLYDRAARVIGFVDARFKASGSVREPITQPQYERVLHALHATLGVERIAELMTAGAAMNEDDVAEMAAGL